MHVEDSRLTQIFQGLVKPDDMEISSIAEELLKTRRLGGTQLDQVETDELLMETFDRFETWIVCGTRKGDGRATLDYGGSLSLARGLCAEVSTELELRSAFAARERLAKENAELKSGEA